MIWPAWWQCHMLTSSFEFVARWRTMAIPMWLGMRHLSRLAVNIRSCAMLTILSGRGLSYHHFNMIIMINVIMIIMIMMAIKIDFSFWVSQWPGWSAYGVLWKLCMQNWRCHPDMYAYPKPLVVCKIYLCAYFSYIAFDQPSFELGCYIDISNLHVYACNTMFTWNR